MTWRVLRDCLVCFPVLPREASAQDGRAVQYMGARKLMWRTWANCVKRGWTVRVCVCVCAERGTGDFFLVAEGSDTCCRGTRERTRSGVADGIRFVKFLFIQRKKNCNMRKSAGVRDVEFW